MKKVIFVIDSLACGGAEKSLVTLLNLFDYNQYEVSLQLFGYDGEFMRFVPAQVKLLPLPELMGFHKDKISKKIYSGKIRMLAESIVFSIVLRVKKQVTPNEEFRLYWRCFQRSIRISDEEYDVAIAYGQRLPTAYVARKVRAKRKLAWINIIPQWKGAIRDYMKQFYDQFNNIITVSRASYNATLNLYPQYADKLSIIYDIVSLKLIQRLAEENAEHVLDTSIPVLLTVARLDYVCKGYDIALETAKILKERGVRFKWYALGRGPNLNQMKDYIVKHDLEDMFILLGSVPNPYPYYKACTLYVQTSRYEGYGISIAEARMLNRPVVTTEFSAVYTQMVNGKNGIVTSQDSTEVANAIELLLNNPSLYNEIIDYQKHERKGNEEEINKVYSLME